MNEKKKKDRIQEHSLTYDDYASLDDGLRYELYDGKLELMSPAPTTVHQMVSCEIQWKISESCRESFVVFSSPIDLILSDQVVMQPDLLLINKERIAEIVRKRGIVGPPDLVIEILSPSSLKRDKETKRETYARFEIPEYWVVDPENGMLEQYLLMDDHYGLPKILAGEDRVQSSTIPCANFSMKDILDNLIEIPKDD